MRSPPAPIVALTPLLAGPSDARQIAALRTFAQAADALGFDLLLLGDDAPDLALEPLTAAAALAAVTRRIGLAAAARTDIGEPFTVARGFAAFDHLSGGRSAWRIRPGDADARGREFVEVAFALWASWDADAVLFDKGEARFSDSDKVRRINHQGSHFQVRGPLNTPRPFQGRPIVILGAEAGDDGIAGAADLVLGQSRNAEAARGTKARFQALATARGRSLRLLVDCPLETVADRVGWVRGGACDGLNIAVPVDRADTLQPLATMLDVRPGPPATLRKRLGLAA
jgi:alkanesulfonate monooxygenase SsuD/methylene tetrahydromethanopterin reductase-like flavin-dependent oxidoreductase (luciferase family)